MLACGMVIPMVNDREVVVMMMGQDTDDVGSSHDEHDGVCANEEDLNVMMFSSPAPGEGWAVLGALVLPFV